MKAKSFSKNKTKLLLAALVIILLFLLMLSGFSNYTKKANNYNPYLKAMPKEYAKVISKNVDTNKVFQYGLVKDLGLRELLVFKTLPNDNEIKTDFTVELYPSNKRHLKTNSKFLTLNITKDAVVFNHNKKAFGVFKIVLPIVDIERLIIKQKPIKKGNPERTEVVEKPFKKLPNDEKELSGIEKNSQVTLPNPYSFIFKTALEEDKIETLPSSFKVRNDSLFNTQENIIEYSLKLGQTIIETKKPYSFWKLVNDYDKSMIKQIKFYGNNLVAQKDLINRFLEKEIPLGSVFNLSKLASYNALRKVFCNTCSEPGFFVFNNESMLFEPLYVSSNCLGKVNKVLEKPFIDNLNYTAMYIKALDEFSKTNFYDLIERKNDLFIRNLSLINDYYVGSVFDFDVIKANQKVIQKNLNPSTGLKPELVSINNKKMVISAFNVSNYPIEILGLYHANGKEISTLNQANQVLSQQKTIINIKLPRSFENLFVSKKKKIVGFVLPKHVYELRIKYKILGLNEIRESMIVPYQLDEVKEEDLFRSKTVINNHKHLIVNKEKREITFSKDSVVISSPLVIPNNYTFKLKSGTIINIIKGGKIISNSPLNFIGSKKNPIYIYSSDEKGEGILVLSERKKSILKYVNFDQLKNPKHGNWSITGAVTFYESPVDLEYVTVKNNRCEDALNIVRTSFTMKSVIISNTQSDAFDGDFVTGTISNCRFDNLGNDAIDISGSDLIIKNVVISNAGDKGLSAGENSKMNIDNIEISNSEIAIAGKDLSVVDAKNLKIMKTKLGFTAFQKKPEFGPSKITVKGITMTEIETKYLIESSSSLFVDGKKIETTQNVKDRMYGVEFGINSSETRNTPQ